MPVQRLNRRLLLLQCRGTSKRFGTNRSLHQHLKITLHLRLSSGRTGSLSAKISTRPSQRSWRSSLRLPEGSELKWWIATKGFLPMTPRLSFPTSRVEVMRRLELTYSVSKITMMQLSNLEMHSSSKHQASRTKRLRWTSEVYLLRTFMANGEKFTGLR